MVALSVVGQVAHKEVDLAQPNPLVVENSIKRVERINLSVPRPAMHAMLGVMAAGEKDISAIHAPQEASRALMLPHRIVPTHPQHTVLAPARQQPLHNE